MKRPMTEIEAEVEELVAAIESDPDERAPFDLDQDGQLDESERELLRALLRSELLREVHGEEPHRVVHDRYRLIRLIGSGAQGELHLALDERENRFVAVKIASLASAHGWKSLELFEREARTLQHLDHPNIPAYFDYFHQEDSDTMRLVLVREYVHGASVEELMAAGARLSLDELRALVRDVLSTLDYLHGLSPPIVHRDIKPSNILRRTDGTHVLADFGAVQAVLPEDTGGSTIVGTSGYMPPEQLMGRATPRSDLYAVGATMLRILTGREPSKVPVSRMRFEWRDLARVDDGLAEFVDRLVEPAVEDRYETAAAALKALPDGERGSRATTGSDSYALQVMREPTEASGAVTRETPPPPNSFVSLTETENHLEVRIPSRPGVGMVLLVVGVLLAAGGVALGIFVSPAAGIGALFGLYIAHLGAGTAYESTVLVADDEKYDLKREGLLRTTGSDGPIDSIVEAFLKRDSEGNVVALVLDTKHDGNVVVHTNCEVAEADWLAKRVNLFVDKHSN